MYSAEKEQTTKKAKITTETKEKITKNGRTFTRVDNQTPRMNI